ncbi:serine protease [Altericroceibacterium spongiae]|uniref:Serine protease n=2 Tax=Altericroceibacterium spongiae TaxID=2320269 RepID=A0A420EMV1_9SPHN|nr:serine protease [Altericroceibacterium spongiae]
MFLVCLFLPAGQAARAEPSDINAAARGVVRILIVERDGKEVYPVSHGTGFAITPERIVTNAHVVEEARNNADLAIGIVPSDGGKAVYGRLLAVSQRNDLALVATTSSLNLPPLTLSGNPDNDSGPVTAVGYPMNVDRAQGLDMNDIFKAQPPVKSTGFLSGDRPTRDFDTLLHTAPIARGNSGGPLLDNCGRVVGVNSFGAESGGADAEFFFAVSNRELLPFLRANNITPQVNGLPCRSFDDLDQAEQERARQEQMNARLAQEDEAAALSRRRSDLQRRMQYELIQERDDGMALATFLLVIAFGAGGFGLISYQRNNHRPAYIAGGIAIVALAGSAIAWAGRPNFDELDDRVERAMHAEADAEAPGQTLTPATEGAQKLSCTIDLSRSRVTGSVDDHVDFTWTADGCVNSRTQYGFANGNWSRVLVPNTEANVSVASYRPNSREYRVDRYLLGHQAMDKARSARAEYKAPECGSDETAITDFGNQQNTVLSMLPSNPNERLVYTCTASAK